MGQEYIHIQDALKEFYTDAIINQLPTVAPLWAQIKKLTSSMVGKRVVIPVTLGFPESVGARAANNYALPTAGRSIYDQAYINMKRNYGRVGIDGFSIEAAKGKGGWVDLLTNEMENIAYSFNINIDRQTMMDGLGRLATVVSVSGAPVVTVKDPGGIVGDLPVTKWFRKGQMIDIYTPGSPYAIKANSVLVTAVSSTGITIEGTISAVAANDLIYMEDVYAAGDDIGEMMGIDGIISTVDVPGTEFQGIDRNTNPEWQAHVESSVGLIDDLKIQQIMDSIEQRTDGTPPDLLITTYAIRNKLWTLAKTGYQPQTLTLKGGWKAYDFQAGNVNLPLLVHKKCPVGYIYFLNQKHLKIYMLKNLVWDDRGGGVVKPVAGFDMVEAWFKLYSQLSTNMPNSMGKGTGITVSL